MENNKPINRNCWVASFDVLGFKSKVKDFPVEFIRDKLKEALEQGKQFDAVCRFKHISDTFVFYTEDDKSDSFLKIRDVSMCFFDIMLTNNNIPYFPMRGCLNIGHFYSDENNGIFFGQAFNEAHELAEDQNWIGFVLSEKAIAKIKEYELAGVKTDIERWFQEYNVPLKKETKDKILFAYKMNFIFGGSRHINLSIFLRTHLSRIGSEALDKLQEIGKCLKYEKVVTKYINTEDFLVFIYPSLKNENKLFIQDELCSLCVNKAIKSVRNTI